MARPRMSPKTAGFTLTELAIAIGCVAILTSVVITMKGFIVDAQTKSTFHKLTSIQHAAHNWSKRARGGQGYAGGSRYPNNVRLSMGALIGSGVLPDEGGGQIFPDWKVQLPPIQVGPTGPNTPGIGQTRFWLRMCAPNDPTGDDLESMAKPWKQVVPLNRYQGVCPCSTCALEFILE